MTAPITRLPAIPELRGLYARALAAQARTALTRAPRSASLPAGVLEVRGVRAEAAHLTAYQHLLGMRAADELPAGFVHVLAFPLAVAVMSRPGFPLPLLGMVHVTNEVRQHRGLPLGADLTVRAWAQELRSRGRGTQVELVVEVSDDDGVAWRGTSTYLARGVRFEGLAPAAETPRDEGDHPTRTAEWRLGADVGRRYARVSGDINPIHTSRLGAKALGFSRPIAHGMYTAARALAEVGPRAGDSFEWTVEFAAPVYLPGRVQVAIADVGTDAPRYAYRGWGRKLNFKGEVTPRSLAS